MTFDELSRLLQEPSRLEAQHLTDLMMLSQQYPYCAPLHHLILTSLHRTGDLRFASELHKRILYITEPKSLFFTLKDLNTAPVLTSILEEDMDNPRDSFDLVNNFLEDHPDDSSDIEQMLDHLRSSDMEESEPEESTSEIIAQFLNRGEKAEIILPESTAPTPTEEPGNNSFSADNSAEATKDDELFTETLARIYIRQRKYDQALRIFKSLNLKYSKKNSYFAEQIAFLEKLVRNSTK